MYIIAGLGKSPTKEYAGTRHNVGFEVIDRLAEDCRIDVKVRVKAQGYLRQGVY